MTGLKSYFADVKRRDVVGHILGWVIAIGGTHLILNYLHQLHP
jgi:hypothetical protein